MPPLSAESRRWLGGLVTRRERWGLSARGWLAVLTLVVTAGAVFLFGVHPFFAITTRVETRLLAVEGWVDLYAIKVAAEEFRGGRYERVFTTGGPLPGLGGYTNDDSTSASLGAGRLRQVGLPPEVVQMVPSRVLARDRTYSSALALKAWCVENKIPLTRINVLTADVHARRTRLLFEKALGPGVEVGIIAVPHPDYDARRWWAYSQGVRVVLGECIAYVYARVFFHP
jgi:uncharacterized SAM-binding protein YcdF (DUF218 family)